MKRKLFERGGQDKDRVTLADVAAHVGTSTITVSRAIRRPEMVSEALRKRIAEAVDTLGYVPDPAAQALASRRSRVIGVLIPSVTNSVFADVLSGLYDTVGKTAYSVQVGNTRYDPLTEEELTRVFIGQRPAGLIVAGIDQTSNTKAMLERAGCPVIQIMEFADGPIDSMIGFSHRDAARAATEHLIAQGYKAPGFIGARMDPRSQRRLNGFRQALQEADIPIGCREITTVDPSRVGLGASLLDTLLERAPETDAVFCNNDDLALGVQFGAQRRGLKIGAEFGICGFNDLEVMAAAYPAITSVRTFRREMGMLALQTVLDNLDDPEKQPTVTDLGYELMARASTDRQTGR
ncbi:LacI family DNA-binding transcriptional regulator [Notoacmeibacter sp. MSK16QG-6]|uniref:LacI family DNA-binding transcriptional regulator n=1 Tax=Notoacmeibacter sp. MSK16QG-6 TaxID=2957982 RepID=UPI0020A1BFCD|nr:LacI family DNA-binding transcriptional regulator [Notoacmeibacter sp. MSK16QG-6]MCP1200256.1 LacI family DNA-binding transcriptional regulator [Notoacmeibacter sp. MSK16QG-6]